MTRALTFLLMACMIGGVATAATIQKGPADPGKIVAEAANPAPPSAQDKLIESILVVSGIKQGAEQLPDQIIGGAMQSMQQAKAPAAIQEGFAKMLREAYPKQLFVDGIRAALKKNYDEARYTRIQAAVSTPLALRMAALEKENPTPEAVQRYMAQLKSNPPSKERIRLIEGLDVATGTSAMQSRVTFTNLEAMALGSLGECAVPATVSKVKAVLASKRPAMNAQIAGGVRLMMAYIYRNATDADLGAYLKMHRDPDGKFLNRLLSDAYEEQFKSGGSAMARNLQIVALATRPEKTMFAPKCEQFEDMKVSNREAPKARISRAHIDARECLKFEDTQKVMACAGKYR